DLCRQVRERVVTAADHALAGESGEEVAVIHQLAPAVRRQLLTWVKEATSELPEEMRATAANLERVSRELHRVEAGLGKVPSDDVIRPVLEELRGLHGEQAAAGRDALQAEDAATAAQSELATLERQRGELSSSLTSLAMQQTRVSLAEATQRALEE